MEILDRRVVTELVVEAKVARGLTWAALADALDAPLVWSTAALLGQHPLSAEQAGRAVEVLGLPAETAAHLQRVPVRGPRTPAIAADPTVYRLQEAVNVYGETIKELVHEEFGDGIMSAIPPRRRPRPPPRRGPRGHHPGREVPALRLGVRSRQRPTTT